MSLLTGGTITGPSRGISSLTNRSLPSLTSLSHRNASVVAFAKKEGGVSSRTRRSDNRGKKGLVTTTEEEKGPNPQQNEELELVACGIAVATYNQGATDFRETPAYKESMQSKELLDDSNSSSSEVFEQNPTEVAPPLE
ncbi:AT-rich interactive domain protein [Rhynchospora pubera]|uniref:AT-rich interactive domain protein n=1 Tax=Rhynchospora pubera TaxID=906938 RepID=A0AAV8HC13_9POAL|nr:AT-rich interactive domain protein [Rhynchospora pubera]